MSLSFLAPSRTVLLVSDEALFIYSTGAKGVRLVDTVPWSAENFVDNVAQILSKDCGGKPVLVLNDMVEQHYRKERIPKVSVMDKQNVVKRKLMVAFQSYPIRAALPLKEKSKDKKGKKAGSSFIFAAIPATDIFDKIIAATRKSLAPIAGFCLLPIESSDMVQKLSEKLASKGQKKSKWKVFIGLHKGGGLRQVVTCNGDLALTRMTPVTENEEDVSQWASDVYQEFTATMSYLSRFGFNAAEGLDVVFISESAAGEKLGELIETPCNYYSVSSQEAADLLKMPLGYQEDLKYADVLHLAWAGRKNKFILPMKAKVIDKVSQPRQVATLVSFILVLALGYQAYNLMGVFESLSQNWEEIDSTESQKSNLTLQYDKEVKKKQDMGFDIQLIQSSLAIYDDLNNRQIKIDELFKKLSAGLGRDLRIDEIKVKRGGGTVSSFIRGEKPEIPIFILTMQMTFPSSTDVKKGNMEVQKLREKLQTLLNDHTVMITKLLEDYEYSEEIVVETGSAGVKNVKQDYVAEISIEGPRL
ncbi:MAG: hypothetical protein OEY94_02320 [Alphaproteobacteria bacterium]|nr:hypothetical protein [Alphaproteobacteria bacterium]